MKVLRGAKRILDRIVDGVSIGLLAFFTTAVFVAVVFRYAFNFPLAWAEEASRFSFIWMTLLGSVICLRENAHLGIDLLVATLPERLRRFLNLINGLVIAAAAAIILVFGVKLFEVARLQLSPAIGIPMTWIYAALPISGFLFLIELAAGFGRRNAGTEAAVEPPPP